MPDINIILNDIRDANIDNVNVPRIPEYNFFEPRPTFLNVPPVTVNIGSPVVDLPGCVEYHKDERLKRENLPTDDEDGTVVLCDAGMPKFDSMDYEPNKLIFQQDVPPPVVKPPETPEIDTPEVPAIPKIEEEVPCPGPAQLRVGDITQSGDEKVVGHELSKDGQTCVTLYEPTSPVEKYVPSINQVTTVTALAVVATAGAAATPLLIRIIRPVVKKIITTAQKKIGKKITKPTRQDIITDEYRKKKGLPPIKR